MAKPEWGQKRVCSNCNARFYDLLRNPIICPKCDTVQDAVPPTRGRRPRPAGNEEKKTEPLVADADADTEAEEESLDEEATLDQGEGTVEPAGDSGTAEPQEKTGKSGAAVGDSLLEDASDLGEDDDDMAEVREHLEDGEDG